MSLRGRGPETPYAYGVPRVRLSCLLAVTLVTTVLLAGCAADDEPGAAPAGPDNPAATSPDVPAATPAPPPTDQPSASAPTRRPGSHKTGLLAPRQRTRIDEAHLLPADQMPGLGDDVAWTVRSTASEDPAAGEAVGACQKTAIGAIGAVSSVRRTYDAPGGLTATQVVARFADAKSAWRAHQVLSAWRDDCAERLAYPHAEVGPLRPVRVHVGTGDSYLAAYGQKARARQRSTGLGILRAGSYLALVEISAGPDAYPDDRDPTRVVVRRISRTF
jgi:hypothetical protein